MCLDHVFLIVCLVLCAGSCAVSCRVIHQHLAFRAILMAPPVPTYTKVSDQDPRT